MVSTISFAQFEEQALAEGYNEVLERVWEPNQKLESHTHPYAVSVMVIKGEMWLTQNDHTQHVKPGDKFKVAQDALHAEVYGPEGTTFWVARAHPL
jgi:quercetin dioxygenase-like cupin family protein